MWNSPRRNGKCTRITGRPAPVGLSTLTLPGRECNPPPPKRPALAQNCRPGVLRLAAASVKPVLSNAALRGDVLPTTGRAVHRCFSPLSLPLCGYPVSGNDVIRTPCHYTSRATNATNDIIVIITDGCTPEGDDTSNGIGKRKTYRYLNGLLSPPPIPRSTFHFPFDSLPRNDITYTYWPII